ncbi:SWIM zinc finger family protein [Planctomicrobium sp. SH661]|uniref:SWIM zinc finger family protein n=1 Tax=Planctomicrobium sp. SH661 TaxID=3448124 RepID=UPI003F5BFCAC
MQLSFEQIAQLAQDEKSLVAARQSMSPRLWSGLGMSAEALWGRCQGSATYDVSVDLHEFAHRCNCPSRKRPCRHVLALLLLASTQLESIPREDAPERVADWLSKRRLRSQQKKSPPLPSSTPVDEEGQRRRAARREDRIDQGIAQLEVWMCDLVRNGLAGLEAEGTSPWEMQARRLVDAQAGGLANRIRSLGEIPASSRDWPKRLLHGMGRLELLLEAYRRIDELPAGLKADVRQLIGWNVSQQELESSGERVSDRWVVIGQQEEDDDRLRVQRTWMMGLQSRQIGLILQFAPGSQPFSESYFTGTMHTGELLFYPGAVRRRARCLDRNDVVPFRGELPGQTSLASVLEDFAEQLNQQPWLAGGIYVLKEATISLSGDQWFLRDSSGEGVPLVHPEPWRLLAETGGVPVDMAFEWTGTRAILVSIVLEGTLTSV